MLQLFGNIFPAGTARESQHVSRLGIARTERFLFYEISLSDF
jgi:hypothetical protein